ncbi:SCO6745 family protein [Brevibacterium samyangense]|uniref:SalK n=1 Tax=Brevibacterium samyangense TaxID=366888 RepID=A0ABN2TKM9_9MICO
MDNSQRGETGRRLFRHLDTVHAASYFAPEVAEALAGVGLDHPAGQYLASRTAPLGAVPSAVVTATFYNFAPAHVARHVPGCWDVATPREILDARTRGVEALLARLFGPGENAAGTDGARSAVVERSLTAREITARLQPVLDELPDDGRPLFAAHRSAFDGGVLTESPDLQAFMDLWIGCTLVREFRGDGHIGALLSHGLTGLEALVLHCATGTTFTPRAARRSRGWTEEEWADAEDALREHGLLTGSGDEARITDAGARLREEIEAVTDTSSAQVWKGFDDAALMSLASAVRDLSRVVVSAEAFPAKVFRPASGRVR